MGENREELKKLPPPSPAVLWIVNVREIKQRTEKKLVCANKTNVCTNETKEPITSQYLGSQGFW